MSQCGCFEQTLHYVSPSHGGWGVVRIAALVPESHHLFVCPFACGRHTALGGEMNGIKEQVSYLFIDEADIISGDYEQMIINGVDDLFEGLDKIPKVLFIFTACLDDLLGTDHEPIIAELSEKYPDVQFRHCKMNPISLDSKLPPGVTLQMNMYSLLEKSTEQKNTVNLIGINTVAKNGDLRDILAQKGYRLLHISEYDRFEDFKEMSSSKLDILAGPAAKMASKDMEKDLGIPTVEGYVTYREQDIDAFYTRLSEALGEDLLPLTAPYRDKARQKIAEAKAVIGDYPIAVDYQAVLRPFSLALMLAENGFRIAMVASDGIPAFEQENYEKLMELVPDLLLVNPLHHDSVKFGLTDKDFLCIGFDCGYITASDKVANLMEDDYMYGYDGVCRLMDMLTAAFNEKADVSEMIEKAGLII